VIVLFALAIGIYFTLDVTPVTAFVKGNVELFSGITYADTALLERLRDEAFTANWQIVFNNVRYLSSAESGGLNLNFHMSKTKYDAAFSSVYDFSGLQFNRHLVFIKGKNAYFGRPEGKSAASCMELNGNENMSLTDRLPVIFTQFKTKEEFFRVLNSFITLFTESIDRKYIRMGTGEYDSRITGGKEQAETITLFLDREGIKSVFSAIKDKLGETPGAYDNIEKMFGYISGKRNTRDIIESDLSSEIDALPGTARLTWTVYKKGGTAAAADICYTNADGDHHILLQNEINNGMNTLHARVGIPALKGNEALHLDFDLGIRNEGEYISGKKYGVTMKIDYRKGKESLYADMQTDAVLSQLSAEEYHTSGDAALSLKKNGKSKVFDVSYDFSYTFNEPMPLSNSAEYPVDAVIFKAVQADPETFVRSLFESFSSPFLLDDVEEGSKN